MPLINAKVEGLSGAQVALAARADRVMQALSRKILLLSEQFKAKVQGNLSAGIGLKSRHGTAGLAGSVRVIPPELEGTAIVGGVEAGGGPFWYGRMWEYTGHKEIVPVTKKVLRFFVDGKAVFAMRVAAQGPRPWITPPFIEFKPTIAAELGATANRAMAGEEP